MNLTGKYILDAQGEPVPEPDLMTWANWFETAMRRVQFTRLGNASVSTVFLGLDHSFRQNGPPIVWETLVFGGPVRDHMMRCAGNREQADAMHQDELSNLLARWQHIGHSRFCNRKRRLKFTRQLRRQYLTPLI